MNITGGKYNGRVLKAPVPSLARPTLSKVRMGVFNVLYSMMGGFNGKIFLDVFSGSGIMGLEALSRGFSKAVGIEKNKIVYEIAKSNYKALGLENGIISGDSLKLLKHLKEFYDVIYIDPPYYSGVYESVLAILPDFDIAVVEHCGNVDFTGFEVLQSKNYGGKRITFIS